MSKRVYSIDNLRGFLMLLVVLGHVLLGFEGLYTFGEGEELVRVKLLQYIYSFHMPAFFALSGYFFCAKEDIDFSNLGRFLVHKCITLMLPYFMCSIAYWCVKRAMGAIIVTQISVKELLYIGIRPIEFMWYLYALFFINCFAGILKSFIKNKYLLLGISAFLVLISVNNTGICAVDYVKNYMIFFCVGSLLADVKNVLYRVSLCLVAGVTNVFLFVGQINIPRYSLVLALSGVIFWIMLFLLVSENKKMPFLFQCGENGMPIYIMHVIVVGAIRIILNRLGIVGFTANLLVGFLGAVIICYFTYTLIIRKIKILDFFFYPERYIKSKAGI